MAPSNSVAWGILEVRGMVALAAAVDRMFKVATVQLSGCHQIGSGWLTVVIEGVAADVQDAIDAGQAEAAAQGGEVITAAVLPRAEAQPLADMPHTAADLSGAFDGEAVGFLETKGVVPLVAGVDAMVKAGDVQLAGWTFIGGALVHAVVTGSVGDVQAAVAAGEQAARRAGEFHASLVLSQPEPQVGALAPPRITGDVARAGALGVVETTGYVGAVAAGDGMSKGADVELTRLTIGSGGRVATVVTGRIDEVGVAVDAGHEQAGNTAEVNGRIVIPGPDALTLAAFAQPAPEAPVSPRAGQAMGLVETRTTVGLVKALDTMLKEADVIYEGRYKVGYFLTALVVRGETGAVETAVDVARRTVSDYGELVAAHVIPLPYDTLQQRLSHA